MQKTVLEKRIDDLSMISGTVDLALSAKDKLLHAKEQIIDNLKTIVALLKDNQQEGGNPPIIKLSEPGVKECCEFIEIHTSSSAVLNGLLLWADVQRQTTPENVWKAQTIKTFLKEDITQAKELLWRVGGDVCRQGTTKAHSEVNDICAAMKVLSENDSLPMFLGTSGMVSQTPIYISDPIDGDSSEMNIRLKVIEESLDSVLKSVSLNSETLKNIHGFSKELSNTINMNREEENINATSDVNS